MDPVSLAFGVIPLFHSCLEFFQLFKTAQSAKLDVQVLLFKLDCHHEDLIIWGEKHGFFNESQPQAKRSIDVFSRLETALCLLETLFKDSSALHERYGVVVSNDDHEPATTDQGKDKAFPSSAGLRRLNWRKLQRANPRNNSGGQSAKPSLGVLQKTRWAICDKGKFEELVKKIGDLVGQVEKILPVPDEFRNQTALRDIMSLIDDLSRLKLFQTASASIRPAWANAASGLIIASEAASVRGPGTISHWIEQVEDGSDTDLGDVNPLQDGARLTSNGKTRNKKPIELEFNFKIETLWSLWFAFLPSCPSLSLGLSCDTMLLELGKDCPAFIGEDDYTKKWGLGPKVKSGVKKSRDVKKLQDMLEKVSNLNYDMQETLADVMESISDGFKPSSTIHIYCAPCRCAVRTALILCRQRLGDNPASVRIDDRIPTECCNAQSIPQRLRSFITTVNARELAKEDVFPTHSDRTEVDYIDKEWIENRIYTLESALYDGEGHGDRFKCIESFFNDVEKDEEMHSVVLLETSGGAWILQTPPFRKSPLMPKQLEVFKYHCPREYSWKRAFRDKGIYRGTFTPSKLNFPQPDLENPRKRQRQD